MRIVCLSADAADICAQIGAWDDVVAVSAYAAQEGLPRRPVVSGFSNGDPVRIARFLPDLVIMFSDVQADLAAQLIRSGLSVLATNQRTLVEVADAIRLIGRAVDRAATAKRLAEEFTDELEQLSDNTTPCPRVYFEEWPDPLICGIGWVGEIVELSGGEDVFASRRGKASRERGVESAEVIAANPDIILASWCGKPVEVTHIVERPGWEGIAAVRNREIHVLDPATILQPGPRLLEGARIIRDLFAAWRARRVG